MEKETQTPQLPQNAVISHFFKNLKWKLTSRTVCDSCGKVNPKILKTKSGYSRYTQCCAYSENQSAGKTWMQRLKFPIVFYWSGFWS
jgi:hypothetical protein